MGGVNTIDVKRRLGLGIAKLLRILKNLGKGLAGLFHAGQDVIAGAVQNARHTFHAIAGKTFAQRLDRGDAPGNGSLEHQADTLCLGKLGQCRPMMRQQRLVGGHHMFAGLQRACDKVERNPLFAANHLDDNIDIIAGGDVTRIIDPVDTGHVESAVGITASRADHGQHQIAAGNSGKRRPVVTELAGNLTPNDTKAGNADTQRAGGIRTSRNRSFVRRHGDPLSRDKIEPNV